MAKNFDEIYGEDREFVIAGETFNWRPVHWRTYGEWFERIGNEDAEAAKKKTEEGVEGATEDGVQLIRSFEQMVDGISLYLDDDEAARFKEVANDRKRPITAVQLDEIFVWLTEVQARRPTSQPLASSDGDGIVVPISQVV